MIEGECYALAWKQRTSLSERVSWRSPLQ